MNNEDPNLVKRRLERLAWLLDSSIRLPTTRFRIGLDGLIGFIPGIGDVVGGVVSSYIIAEAVRMGVPKSAVIRMAFNVLIETLVGMIPVAGDIFDLTWKANNRNVRLLQLHATNPRQSTTKNRVFAIVLGIVLLSVIIGIIWLGVALISWLVQALSR